MGQLTQPMRYLVKIWHGLDRNLRARILLPTALLFALILGAMVVAAAGFYAADMERELHEKAEIFAGMVANGVGNTMLGNRPQELSEVLTLGTAHRPDIRSISVLRRDGEVASSSRRELVGTRPWRGEMARFTSQQVVTAPEVNPEEFAVVRPIGNAAACATCHGGSDRFLGWLDLRLSRRPVIAQQARLAQTLGLAAAAAFLCLMAIAWWLLGREAISPLRRLVASMKRAESGDLSVRADEGRPDELGDTARGFDAMLCALRRSQTELEAFYRERMVRADRFAAVGELATGLAHEIKNPLAGLSGALELLAEDLARSPRQAEVVSEMRHQVARLGKTMESLLSYARPPRARLETTDVNAALEKVLFLVTQQRRAAPRSIRLDLGKDLPPVLADPNQLEQVLLNLCLNACQAMGGGQGCLRVRTFAGEDSVAVEVGDDGPGIAPEARPHIFQPFYTTKGSGNGLGLAISARIVAEHGGHIGYRCPPEGGTIFAVTLQRAQALAARAPESVA